MGLHDGSEKRKIRTASDSNLTLVITGCRPENSLEKNTRDKRNDKKEEYNHKFNGFNFG